MTAARLSHYGISHLLAPFRKYTACSPGSVTQVLVTLSITYSGIYLAEPKIQDATGLEIMLFQAPEPAEPMGSEYMG